MSHNACQTVAAATKKLLRVALVGAPNAGKSTLLNRLISSDISCVSNKVHTTRTNILGVITEGDTQLEFYDSPGIVTRQHLLKHRLEDSLLKDPIEASNKCDLIAVIVDASNERERRKLNRGLLSILLSHSDKKSYLILNKIDLLKHKRILLDIATRLTDGHLAGIRNIPESEVRQLNKSTISTRIQIPHTSPHVIELDSKSDRNEIKHDDLPIGYRNFSQIFSVSALEDDGVDELREKMIQTALPVEIWPHGPDFVSSQNTKDIVHSIIRGKVMDNVEYEIPYVTQFKYLDCRFDDLGALHLSLNLVVPKRYMIGKLLGQHGVIIFKIINESRDLISKTLGCDVKLAIEVKSKQS